MAAAVTTSASVAAAGPADEALGHLFMRVNTSAKGQEIIGSRMFSEWTPLQETIQVELFNELSVLSKFPLAAGMGVATPVVKHLASSLGITSNSHCEPSRLEEGKEVLWCMEVLSYGLGLPLAEHDTIRDSVNVYCEWLMALLKPKICVPKPICDDPNRYAQIMIKHFYGVFVPRRESNVDSINRQVVLCHRVLRTLQKIARESSIIVRETWESMLMLLLAINEALLGPPAVKDDIGDQLCERVVGVLFEVWLLSCARCFPAPSLWRTFRDMCLNWRHRINLVDQWNRVNTALASKLLRCMYGPSFPELKIGEEDWHFTSIEMSNDRVAQSFFRFLHLLGNPVELCRPAVISNTPKFLHYAITSEFVVDPCHHACLGCLPAVFLRAMRGVSLLVDAFLGIANCAVDEFHWSRSGRMPVVSVVSAQVATVTPPQSRKPTKSGFGVSSSGGVSGGSAGGGGGGGKTSHPKTSLINLSTSSKSVASATTAAMSSSSMSIASTASQSHSHSPSQAAASSTSTQTAAPVTPTSGHQPSSFSMSATPSLVSIDARPPLAPSRPKCNSILHMFGAWLFEAAMIGTRLPSPAARGEMPSRQQHQHQQQRPGSLMLNASSRRGSVSGGVGQQQQQQQQLPEDRYDVPAELSFEHYESGRAEAIGALCRIFCAKKTGEDVLPVYLARFYVCLRQGLRAVREHGGDPQAGGSGGGQVLCEILLNSCDLLCLDLDGVMTLVPEIIDALDLVLPEREQKFRVNFGLSLVDLRRASIHLLLSMLHLPFHFRNLPVKDILSRDALDGVPPLRFQDLRPRLINLLVGALQSETDSVNMQLLLGGLLSVVQDVAASEAAGFDSAVAAEDSTSASVDLVDNFGSSFSDRASNCTINETTSDTASEFSSFSSPNDSTYALFVRATYLVCQRLSSSWKMDLSVSLAALELLSGFAKIKIPNQARRLRETLECRLPVRWICDYIVGQCSRPPQFHSKDLHSNIVAAFRCVAIWLLEHPYLLADPDCLATVTEVIELGISGSKSASAAKNVAGESADGVGIGVSGDTTVSASASATAGAFVSKGRKECKPASMRVRDAAESLLAHVMEHVGNFPSPIGQASLSSLLDEEALVWHRYGGVGVGVGVTAPVAGGRSSLGKANALGHFKYFAVDNSLIVALLEQPLGNDQDPQPTVTVLMRGPFGRNAWLMQLRHLPRHKSGAKLPTNPGRPLPISVSSNTDHAHRASRSHLHRQSRYFPDSVNSIAPCRAERSIPPLESVLVGSTARQEHATLAALVEQQIAFEESERRRNADARRSDSYPNPETECRVPKVCHEFETARLFLAHFGFLSSFESTAFENDGTPGSSGVGVGIGVGGGGGACPVSLTALDATQPGFVVDLEQLDAVSDRTCDTAFVFYVRSGRTTVDDILNNATCSSDVHPHFLEFLLSLGWPVDVPTHVGWTGHTSTSFRVTEPSTTSEASAAVGDIPYDGRRRVLYWSDATAEVAFVVPVPKPTMSDVSDGCAASSVSAPPDPYCSGEDADSESSSAASSFANIGRRSSERHTTMSSSSSVSTGFASAGRSSGTAQYEKPRTLSLDLDGKQSTTISGTADGGKESPVGGTEPRLSHRKGRFGSCIAGYDAKVLVVWLECFEDHLTVPLDNLLSVCCTGFEVASATFAPRNHEKDVLVIFVHALQSGLFRIKLHGQPGRVSMAIPLVDGMVVSRRMLGTLVRQTVVHMCLRRRLENDAYYPPHLRRKLKILDVVHKYGRSMSEPEFCASLFEPSRNDGDQ